MIKNFLKGLLFGSVLGGIGGLLVAPRSGDDTRRKLTMDIDEAVATQEDLNSSLTQLKASIKETKSLAASLIPEVTNGVKKDVEAFEFQAKPRIKRIEKQIQVINSHVSQISPPNKDA